MTFKCFCVECVLQLLQPSEMADQTLRNRELASNFLLTLRDQLLRLIKCTEKLFCNDAIHRTHIFQWCSHLETGQTSVQNFEHSGHPSPSWADDSVAKLHQVIQEESSIRLAKFVIF
jgi:hypothetical protein